MNIDLTKFNKISNSARERIYAQVLTHYQNHPTSAWSGRTLVEFEKTIKKFYASIGEEYKEAFRETLPSVMQEFYDKAVSEIKKAGLYKGVIGEPDTQKIKQFLNSAFDYVAMRTDKMSIEHIQSLRKISAEVFRELSITGHSRREVTKHLLEKAMQIKGFEFIDKAGGKWQNKTYFATLARTKLMNAARASYDDKMAEEGFDVMLLSVSGNSCDKCAKFEGRLFSLTGATKGLPSKSDLEVAGVFHPNCTHSYSLVPDYIRTRDYNSNGTPKKSV